MRETIEHNDEPSAANAGLPASINAEVVAEDNTIVDLKLRYGFKLGEYGLLIPDLTESEVITNPQIFSIPNTTELMIGVISVRGRFAPVFALGKMLDIEKESRQTSIIVLKINGNLIAFPYDSAHSLELPSTVSTDPPTLPDSLSRLAGDLYQIDQTIWIEIDFKQCMDQLTSNLSH